MDTITCTHCQKNMVPRLWHYTPVLARVFANSLFSFQHLKTQHICPLCGGVNFTTGGQLTIPAKITFGLVACIFIYGAVSSLMAKLDPVKHGPTAACKGTVAQCKALALKAR